MAKPNGQTAHRLRRWLLGLLGLVALLTLVMLSLQPAAVMVETARVAHQALVVTVNEQGRTRAREPYVIAAPVSGQLLRTELIEGDAVEAGQILAGIAVASENQRTRAVLEATLVAARARETAAQASLDEASGLLVRAEQESQRREQLFAQRMIGQEERDRYGQARDAAQTREQASRAALAAARADVESARSQLMGSNGVEAGATQAIVAPVAGTVQKVFEKSERVVVAGTPLFQISDGDRLELVIDMLTQEAVRVSPGDAMLITGWGGAGTLHGRVRYIEPQAFTKYSALGVEEQRVNVIGELTQPNPGLGAEYRIEAAVVVDEFADVLTVPTSALFRRDERWHVFVVERDHASLRPVEIGARSLEAAQVLDGLSEGDQVVIFPSDQVEDGVLLEALE